MVVWRRAYVGDEAPVVVPVPVNSVAPVLVHTGTIGDQGTTTLGVWDAYDEIRIRWLRDDAVKQEDGGVNYTPVGDSWDGTRFRSEVSAKNTGGAWSDWVPSNEFDVSYPAPVAAGGLADQVITQDAGDVVIPAATILADFTIVGGTTTIAGSGADATWDDTSGLTIPDDTLQSGTVVTVTATNGGGSDSSAFQVTVQVAGGDVTDPVISNVVQTTGRLEYTATENQSTTMDTYWGYYAAGSGPYLETDVRDQTGSGFDSGGVFSARAPGVNIEQIPDPTSDIDFVWVEEDEAGNLSDPQVIEFRFDTVAPILTAPAATPNGATAWNASVVTDEAGGTVFCVITTSAATPTAAQIKAGQDHTGATAVAAASSSVITTGTVALSGGGLAAETDYYAHFAHEDAAIAPNISAPVSSAMFTTAAASTAVSHTQVDEYSDASPVIASDAFTTPTLDAGSPSDGDILEVKAVFRSTSGKTIGSGTLFGETLIVDRATPTGESQIAVIATLVWTTGMPTTGVAVLQGEPGFAAREVGGTLNVVKNAQKGDTGGDEGLGKSELVLDAEVAAVGAVASAAALVRNGDDFEFPELGTPDFQVAINGATNFFAAASGPVNVASPATIRAIVDAAPTYAAGVSIIYEQA